MAKKESGGRRQARTRAASAKRRTPIADRIVRRLRGYMNAKVVDLGSFARGREVAETLQQTVVGDDELAELPRAFAVYCHAQSQLSVMCEQLIQLDELGRIADMIERAEQEYMPSGPPMSPLTGSFFWCWASFDLSIGLGRETLGTIAIAVSRALGVHPEMLRLFEVLQRSRMGVFVHEGMAGDLIHLRELVTGARCRAICPAGHLGRSGELWFARVLPPPAPDFDEHVVFTTPYVLLDPDESGWLECFGRSLPDVPADRTAAYEQHLKYGPVRDYWNEFVCQAYVNHRTEVIYLTGVPDVPESLPHSRVTAP